jgi:hypothetical protein
VARQPAHPQQLQVAGGAAASGDAEVVGRLGDPDAGVGQQVGQQGQTAAAAGPRSRSPPPLRHRRRLVARPVSAGSGLRRRLGPGRRPATGVPRLAAAGRAGPACARSRRITASRTSTGSSTTAPLPCRATRSAIHSGSSYPISATSQSDPRSPGSIRAAILRNQVPCPRRTRTRAKPVELRRLGGHHVLDQVDAGGHLDRALGPAGLTAPSTLDSRKQRGAPRSRSWPTRYHRPRQDTTPHGSTSRSDSDPSGFRYANRTARRPAPRPGTGCSASSAGVQPRLDVRGCGPARRPPRRPAA